MKWKFLIASIVLAVLILSDATMAKRQVLKSKQLQAYDISVLSAPGFMNTTQIQGYLTQKATPSLSGATVWLNGNPMTLRSLKGKVVLIEFLTYTCINWRRALPYTRAWAVKYKEHGLVVIGVHTPEFSFEHKLENVKKAVKDMNIIYPVAMDNNFEIWNSFQNQYWPALYMVDAKGQLRYHKFGEGHYPEFELQIQQLLKESGATDIPDKTVAIQPEGYEADADWKNLGSAENYLGYSRTTGFASPGGIVHDKPLNYILPGQMKIDQWGLSGEWIVGVESIRLRKGEGKIVYRFRARDLHLVARPGKQKASIKFRVLVNGNPPAEAHGLDIDSDGYGIINEERMYQLIRQKGSVIESVFQIEFLDPEVEVYNFTFG